MRWLTTLLGMRKRHKQWAQFLRTTFMRFDAFKMFYKWIGWAPFVLSIFGVICMPRCAFDSMTECYCHFCQTCRIVDFSMLDLCGICFIRLGWAGKRYVQIARVIELFNASFRTISSIALEALIDRQSHWCMLHLKFSIQSISISCFARAIYDSMNKSGIDEFGVKRQLRVSIWKFEMFCAMCT